MARCSKCFRQKDTVRALPAELIGQERALKSESPLICSGCWFQIDVTLGWLEDVAEVGSRNLKDPSSLPNDPEINTESDVGPEP